MMEYVFVAAGGLLVGSMLTVTVLYYISQRPAAQARFRENQMAKLEAEFKRAYGFK